MVVRHDVKSLEEFNKLVSELDGKNIFALFCGSKTVGGKSWCPDCVRVYEQYPVLWNSRHKDYSNVRIKEEVFKKMFSQLVDEDVLNGMDEKMLRNKIKNLKDVYRQELAKIEKSKINGSETVNIYSPKLVWFNAASFFGNFLSTRHKQPNLCHYSKYLPLPMERIFIPDVLPKASQEKSPVKSPDNVDYLEKEVCVQKRPVGRPRKNRLPTAEEGESSQGTPKRKRATTSPRKRGRPSKQLRKFRRPVVPKAEPGAPLQDTPQSEAALNEVEERPYDQFGKYVAAELAQLPQREAILLQQDIQNCITRCKLSCLELELPAYGQYAEQLIVDVSPSASPASVNHCTDETYASDASGRAFDSYKVDEK